MRDITSTMLEFKEALRHSWNTYFVKIASPMSPDIQEAFGQVERGLFRAIVLAPLGVSERVKEYREKPLSWIVVTPSEHLEECPVQIGERDSSGNTTWGMPISLSVDDSVTFDFFDFLFNDGNIDRHLNPLS